MNLLQDIQNLNEGRDREVGEDLNNVDLLGGTIVIEIENIIKAPHLGIGTLIDLLFRPLMID